MHSRTKDAVAQMHETKRNSVYFFIVLNTVSLIRNAAVSPSVQFRNETCSLLYTSIEVRPLKGQYRSSWYLARRLLLFLAGLRVLQEGVTAQVFGPRTPEVQRKTSGIGRAGS